MASYQKRSNGVIAWVRIKPFKPVSKLLPSRAEAKEWAEKLEATLRAQRRQRNTTPALGKMTIAHLAHEYLADPTIRALKYHDQLVNYLAWWVNHYGAQRIVDTGAALLREARAKLQPGRGPRTVNGYLAALRSAWHWGQAAELVPQDHVWPKRLMLKIPKARVRFLTDEELRALLAACSESALMNAAVRVSIACGLRQGELLRLKWADVDLTGKRSRSGPSLTIHNAKNTDTRGVFLPPSAVAALGSLKAATVVGTHVFLNDDQQPLTAAQLRWKWAGDQRDRSRSVGIREKAGLTDFRWHDLRHSCASYLAQSGANLLEIGSVLGHRNVEVTKKYSHLIEGAPVTGHTKLDEKLTGCGA